MKTSQLLCSRWKYWAMPNGEYEYEAILLSISIWTCFIWAANQKNFLSCYLFNTILLIYNYKKVVAQMHPTHLNSSGFSCPRWIIWHSSGICYRYDVQTSHVQSSYWWRSTWSKASDDNTDRMNSLCKTFLKIYPTQKQNWMKKPRKVSRIENESRL